LTAPNSTNKQIAGVYPHQPMIITPTNQTALLVSTIPISNHSLLLSLQDASGSAIASASAILQLLNHPIATVSSGLSGNPNFGQAFFNTLSSGSYEFTLIHPEYMNLTGSILVNGYTNDTLIMTKK